MTMLQPGKLSTFDSSSYCPVPDLIVPGSARLSLFLVAQLAMRLPAVEAKKEAPQPVSFLVPLLCI